MRGPDQSLNRRALWLRRSLGRLEVLALFPLLTLTAVVMDLGDIVVVTAFLLPALLALDVVARTAAGGASMSSSESANRDGGIAGRDALRAMLAQVSAKPRHDSACILLQIDNWPETVDRYGSDASEEIAETVAARLRSTLRPQDALARLDEGQFGIVLHPIPAARLGIRDTILARIRDTTGEPIGIGAGTVHLSISAGHSALRRAERDPVDATLSAADLALAEALRHGPGFVRAFSPDLLGRRAASAQLTEDITAALEAGQILPWFQPQTEIASGRVVGLEALVRWQHPDRGVLRPSDFLQAVDNAGQTPQLGQMMLTRALEALVAWDDAGLEVPSVSVNLSAIELRDPGFAEQVKWALDRFDLGPARLTVEIPESVAADASDEPIMATLTALRGHGIQLDLDDFGIGQASLAAIRRFGVRCIKIDRSYIRALDKDPEQRAMVAAILSMARHLDAIPLAEGVETGAERDVLAAMGCDRMQGYLDARPMPLGETFNWLSARAARPDLRGNADQPPGQRSENDP